MPRLIIPTVLPFVTVATFKAAPTFLELDNLRSGATSQADQDAELYNRLLIASNWAADFVQMPLHAHTVTERFRARPNRRGQLLIQASDTPVRSVSQIAWGYSIGQMNVYNSPTVRIEYNSTIVYEINGGSYSWGPGPLQINGPASSAAEMYVDTTYVAAAANTLLSAPTIAGATSLPVVDPLGIQPGSILRIWEPGVEEAVVVAANYVPGANPVALTSPLVSPHTALSGVTELSPSVLQAVIFYTTALLTHPDRSAEDEWPDSDSSSTRDGDARQTGAGLVTEAKRLLRLYRDQR